MHKFYLSVVLLNEYPNRLITIKINDGTLSEVATWQEGDILNIKGLGRLRINQIATLEEDMSASACITTRVFFKCLPDLTDVELFEYVDGEGKIVQVRV